MIQQLRQWVKKFKKLWQRLFGEKVGKPTDIKVKPRVSLTDAEYESLFLQLLAGVNDQGWSRGQVQDFLARKNIAEADLVGWLQRFGAKLLAGENRELAARMVRLSEVSFGELGKVAGEIGRELLGEVGKEDEGENNISEVAKLLAMLGENNNFTQQDSPNLGFGNNEQQASQINPLSSASQSIVDIANYWFERGNKQLEAGDFEEAITSYDKALNLKPNYYLAFNNKGRVLFNLGRFEEAFISFDKVVKIKPDYHETWSDRGVVLVNLGRFEEAFVSYKEALNLKPDYHLALHGQGTLLEKLGRFEEAFASFDKAVKFKPDYHEAWNNRGSLLSNRLSRYEEAITSYKEALRFKPDDHIYWYNQGIALNILERFEEAIASYKEALNLKPDYHDAWYNQGIALCILERFEEAVTLYEEILNLQSDLHDAWFGKANALCDLEQFEEAIASFDEAIKFKPDDCTYLYNRGAALCDLERFEEAIASFDEAVKIKPHYHEAWYNRGIAAGKSISCNQLLAFSSAIAKQNPAFNQRGYEGGLISYQEGLKYCPQETHPEGWGTLHKAIGNAHYYRGVGERDYRQYWLKAEAEYHQALITLTPEAFPELHLAVLRDLIRVLFGLDKNEEAKQYRRQALEVFGQLLNSPDKSSLQKRQLAAKFTGFSQMRVDVLIEDGDFVPALEVAERNKNSFLTWILDNQKEHIFSPSYSDIQGLINPQANTAIIYWHLSPFTLTTFIIQPGADKPIVIPTQKPDKLTAWIKNWDQEYENYRKSKKQQASNPAWRDNMTRSLEQLSDILNIPDILTSIQNSNSRTKNLIQNLILIPHRDLHRFPLHALFPDNFIINYLPSAQIGLNSQKSHQDFTKSPNLLIVEYSGLGRENEGLQPLPYTEIESAIIAQIFADTNCKHLSDSAANKTTVKQALAAEYNIFHFSGHGSYDNKNPKNSALYLSRDATHTEPDLTLPEIRNLNLSGYQLVSLSACETAITGNETIETEYVGLVSAFLYQGVSYIVSSLWTVNEISTSLLMTYFYRQLKKGKAPNIALAEAIKWLRSLTYKKLDKFYQLIFVPLGNENTLRISLAAYLSSIKNTEDKLFDSHYHWAGFIITGI
jgi:CHAT domain-containing protein/tetratricopeptide (TPR) repeat protein